MLAWLWLVPALPLAGFVLLALGGGRLPARAVAWIGAGSVGLSALAAAAMAVAFIGAPPAGGLYVQTLWAWIAAGGFAAHASLALDGLSLVMMLVVTGVGFLIHLYSVEFMRGDEGYNRYFAYLNLFVASMLTLVLAGDFVFLFLGWEGVGLCSYLLIGFWYQDSANGAAAQKAFIVTRVGDAAMALGLFVLFDAFGTLDIHRVLSLAPAHWAPGAPLALAAAGLLLAGAVGKSAQLPLQTWLPDAMAGPTPVSALIHAATMVTAGVYLIARTHVLFELAPAAQLAVAVIGAATLVLAGASALAQNDIKRVLAYSTISQIGYMFVALGVGARHAAIFHFMTHAFFKALLFLAAGVVIHALDDEHDISRMGGLRRRLPLAFLGFVTGGASLAALPLVTAGYYSKDRILWAAWAGPHGSAWLWAAAWVGAVLTALYISRLVFLVFFGKLGLEPKRRPGPLIGVPIVVLSLLSVFGGMFEWVLPADTINGPHAVELALGLVAAAASLGGIALAWMLFTRGMVLELPAARSPRRVLAAGFGFDVLYDRLLVRPFRALARLNRADFVDGFYDGLAALASGAHALLSETQSGRLRWYAAALGAGGAALLALMVWS